MLQVAKRERVLIGLALTAQLVSASAMLLFPLAMGNIVDTVSGTMITSTAAAAASTTASTVTTEGATTTSDLTGLVMMMGGVFALSGAATAARVSTMSLAGSRISRDLRVRLYRALLGQDTAFFDVRQTGELVNRLSNDVPQVSRMLTDNLAKVLRSGVTASSSLAFIVYLSPKLALITSLSIPPIALFATIFGRNARQLSRSLVDALAAATQVAAERTAAIRTVRSFGAEREEVRRYTTKVDDTYGLARKVAFADGVYAGSVQLAAQMSLLGVLWFGGRMVIDPTDPMTIGALTSFSMYAVNLGVSVASVGTAYGQLTRALGSAFRIFEVIDRQPQGPSSTLLDKSATAAATTTNYNSDYKYQQQQQQNQKDHDLAMHGFVADHGTAVARKWSTNKTLTAQSQQQRHELLHNFPNYDLHNEDDDDQIRQHERYQQTLIDAWMQRTDTVVQFRDVEFKYPTRPETSVLTGVDLTVQPGEVVGVAGASGSGKSTLSSLLLRLYEPSAGAITLGGVPIETLSPFVLRRVIAVVSQEPVLFSGSIADNIRYGSSNSTSSSMDDGDYSGEPLPMERVMQAARDAASHDMIMSLPQGYDTPVGERGAGLSGGQRARIALARALVRRPRVVVLDEHSAALDAESERAVAQAVRHAAKELNVAVLSIAHRSSSLRRADRVAVLVRGKVKEMDSFDNLMKDERSALRRMMLPVQDDMMDDSDADAESNQQQQNQTADRE